MGTWTNIKIPSKFSIEVKQAQEIAYLNFKVMEQQALIDILYNELENIFESLQENKEISLTHENVTIRAALKDDDLKST